MPPVSTIPIHVNTISAPLQIRHAAVSSHETQQFQQALIRHAHSEMMPNSLIKNGIATIENQEIQFSAAVSRLTDTTASPSTSSMLALQSEHLKMHFAYEATARVISLTAQNITELMRMQ